MGMLQKPALSQAEGAGIAVSYSSGRKEPLFLCMQPAVQHQCLTHAEDEQAFRNGPSEA